MVKENCEDKCLIVLDVESCLIEYLEEMVNFYVE